MRRRADARIASQILHALGDAGTVLNVGAGTGSYEPSDRKVLAVEPSAVMISQRISSVPCVQAAAESLPFRDAAFDAVMGVLTIHHWSHLERGLTELKRVARQRVVLFTWDPDFDERFWLTRDYLPQILEIDRARYPRLADLERSLGPLRIAPVPIPADCTDGFRSAYWKRPEAYLDPEVRQSISAFAALEPATVDRFVAQLAADLQSGVWASRNPEVASSGTLDTGCRIVTSPS